jgi:alkylation response protein AidB-like acyl-CoA dehydrogenase
MFYERSFGISFHLTRPEYPDGHNRATRRTADTSPSVLASRVGHQDDPVVRELVGESHALGLVIDEATKRIGRAVSSGRYPSEAAAMTKVLAGTLGIRSANINFELAGPDGVAWEKADQDLGARGVAFLSRQAGLIGGGTTEMARNAVSERILGMPRERTSDRDKAFRDVPKGPTRP